MRKAARAIPCRPTFTRKHARPRHDTCGRGASRPRLPWRHTRRLPLTTIRQVSLGAWCFLEVNTQPGLTPTSLLPEQAAHCGIAFPRFVCLDGGARDMPRLKGEIARPSRLKLLVRRQRRNLRLVATFAAGFVALLVAVILAHSAQRGGHHRLATGTIWQSHRSSRRYRADRRTQQHARAITARRSGRVRRRPDPRILRRRRACAHRKPGLGRTRGRRTASPWHDLR